MPGDDLSSSYVGCRLIAAGQISHLYTHDPNTFNIVTDPVWIETALRGGFNNLDLLHRYVQTPLWAYSLQPLCRTMRFSAFNRIFIVILMLCFAGTVWMTARYWAPRLYTPLWIAFICAALYISEPTKYALFLAQTHIIFVLMTVAALIWAQRGYPVRAGIMLAIAASIKITPGFLLLYWLLTKRYKAALSFALASLGLVALTILTTGSAVFVAYLRELSELSNVLLVAFNNQSFPAWWMGRDLPKVELLSWHIYKLSALVKITSLLLLVLCVITGGVLDREPKGNRHDGSPYGAVLAFIGATVFTPVAWTHYYIVLLVPVMLLLDASLRWRSYLLAGLAVAVFALNVPPIAVQSIPHVLKSFSLVRSQFYSGIVAIAALMLLHGYKKLQAAQSEAVPVAVNRHVL